MSAWEELIDACTILAFSDNEPAVPLERVALLISGHAIHQSKSPTPKVESSASMSIGAGSVDCV